MTATALMEEATDVATDSSPPRVTAAERRRREKRLQSTTPCNVKRAAEILGLSESHVYRMMGATREWQRNGAKPAEFDGVKMMPPALTPVPPDEPGGQPTFGWTEGELIAFGLRWPEDTPRLQPDLTPKRVPGPGRPAGSRNTKPTAAELKLAANMAIIVPLYADARKQGMTDAEARAATLEAFNARRDTEEVTGHYIYRTLRKAREREEYQGKIPN
jgi:hypothetical protein